MLQLWDGTTGMELPVWSHKRCDIWSGTNFTPYTIQLLFISLRLYECLYVPGGFNYLVQQNKLQFAKNVLQVTFS